MKSTSIEWTDATWNPVSGCTRASEGCDNCYAVTMTNRLSAMGQNKYKGLTVINSSGHRHFNGQVRCHDDELLKPWHWREPRMIFVNSMSDLFHKDVPDEFINKVFGMMALCPQHTFQILTKRADRMRLWSFSNNIKEFQFADGGLPGYTRGVRRLIDNWPLPNVWLGVSVENQKYADERIPHLLQTPAAVRFLSCEPLLGPIEFSNVTKRSDAVSQLCKKAFHGIHWVIVGGESGPGARPMHPDWVRSLRDQCTQAGVSFFFKQWGAWEPSFEFPKQFENRGISDNTRTKMLAADGHIGFSQAEMEGHPKPGLVVNVGKKKAGRSLDGREWSEFPEVSHAIR